MRPLNSRAVESEPREPNMEPNGTSHFSSKDVVGSGVGVIGVLHARQRPSDVGLAALRLGGPWSQSAAHHLCLEGRGPRNSPVRVPCLFPFQVALWVVLDWLFGDLNPWCL